MTMRRRLMVAMIGIALAAVVFVGAGVLALAQFGARADTERSVRDGMQALANLTERSGTIETLRGLEDVRTAFGLSDLGVVLVEADGTVSRMDGFARPRRGRPGNQAQAQVPDQAPREVFTLDVDQLATFADGEALFLDDGRSRRSNVVGLQRLAGVTLDLSAQEQSIGLVARRPVETVAGEARIWFMISALLVLLLAAVAAFLLSRQFTRPITAIERATAGIAAGDFEVRVEADGEDELAQLGRSVNRMANDLQRSKLLDQQFLMSVSHDLRTPLTAISGYAEALRDGAVVDTVLTGEIIGNQANRLERLVGDLLDLARLDANRFNFHFQQLDVAVHVGRTVASLQPTAEGHGLVLRLEVHGSTNGWADPDRLAQCVGNVIDNALKFARTQVTVAVETVDEMARVRVTDDGPGINDEDLAHLFERLYTGASQPVRAENPTGMGLAIVRQLITAMGGSVDVRSEWGRGATMTLLLPCQAPAEV